MSGPTSGRTSQRPRTVVYDVGGVLLDWDPRHLYGKIFDDPARMEWFLREVCTPSWNLAQDGGRPWADAEAEAIALHPGLANEIRAFRARWHEMVPDAIAGSVDLLEELAGADVPLYAITNFAADTFQEATKRFAFFAHFKGIVVSGDEKLLKPDPRIYQLLAHRHSLDLADCVFIDDVARNCDGARACGMHAIQFVSPDATRDALAELGIFSSPR
jgi:2-haloacid dehalogenase